MLNHCYYPTQCVLSVDEQSVSLYKKTNSYECMLIYGWCLQTKHKESVGSYTDTQPVALCNEFTGIDGQKTLHFHQFVSNQPEVFIMFYIFTGHGVDGSSRLTVTQTECQGFKLSCHPVDTKDLKWTLLYHKPKTLIPFHLPKVYRVKIQHTTI